MVDESRPSLMTRLLSLCFFLFLTLASFTWFMLSVSDLVSQYRLREAVVEFDKGSIYMLGCGLALLAITVGGVMQGLMEVKLTSKMELWFTRTIIASIFLMFILPHVAHYTVKRIAESNNYYECRNAEYHWLLYGKYVYTNSKKRCEELILEKAS